MANGLEDRKNHEDKWALDEDQRFKATARRNKLLGLWAAELLGLAGDEAAAYAKTVVASDFAEPGEEDVFRKVKKDLADKGVADDVIRRKMAELTVTAREQIVAGS
ncbi:hypothetical protein FHS83_001310 [Rhizomicrobium palustre]|uniref:DUF1476 domain-containing protein n=1 Tax=Rhizomicrobium palustre TaxID=189966 RepID=A0A846MY66_9PROT|nr:DUF1476 domain-containing protein [Rhizomicrobium palustre]NIK87992.1 hypothetical protein [Rhizomicrobium palustre]